jgi:hypothetical protein
MKKITTNEVREKFLKHMEKQWSCDFTFGTTGSGERPNHAFYRFRYAADGTVLARDKNMHRVRDLLTHKNVFVLRTSMRQVTTVTQLFLKCWGIGLWEIILKKSRSTGCGSL